MRHRVLRKHSTKAERIFYEALKELQVPFKHRWIIHGREVDFLLWGKVVIEIDGHEQDGDKNHWLSELGYIPMHLNNDEVTKERSTQLIKSLNGFY